MEAFKKYPSYKGRVDQALLFITLCLIAIGMIMVYSSSNMLAHKLYDGDSYRYLKVQLIACFLGLVGMLAVSYIPYQYYERCAKPLLLISIVALLLVFSPVGHYVRSSTGRQFHRWIRIAGMQFQPVELVKLALVIYVSQFLSRKSQKMHSLTRGVLPNVLILSVVFILLYKQPDFGSAVLLSSVVVVMLFVGGARLSQVVLITGIACFFVYSSVKGDDYKMQRIHDFVQSLQSPYTVNDQVTQSLNALSLGGVFGVGMGNSIYKIFSLPYPHTDFIFSILGEELGFLGALSVIILFMLLIWRGVHIALNVQDDFASLTALGISTIIGLQTFVNIGVVTGTLPTKGITLPFISYGGSSLLMSLIYVGVLLNISRGMNPHEDSPRRAYRNKSKEARYKMQGAR